jgi:superoxide dismutase, Fe-Mn family
MLFEPVKLMYSMDALEPVIDARTVEIHYTKHHATYAKNLNAALEKHTELFDWPLEKIIANLDKVPEDIRTAVKNNGGGVYNHNLYWNSMAPGQGGEPKGKLAKAIESTFGSYSVFKTEFEKAALARFGSGYCWLSKKNDGSIIIHSTANQDNPLQENLKPLIVVDVWEHAYYLNYQNRRAEYLSQWWTIVDWKSAEERFINAV